MPPIQFLVEKRESGLTIASLLRKRFRISWSQAKRVIEGGHVRVAGQPTRTAEQRVKAANRVWIAPGVIEVKSLQLPPSEVDAGPSPQVKKVRAATALERARAKEESAAQTAETTSAIKRPKSPAAGPQLPTGEVELVYSDDSVVVVNKPAGLTTSRSREDTAEFGARGRRFLPKTLADMLPTLLGVPNRPVRPVHRLDRDTSGLVVFARTSKGATDLTEQFRKHTVDRRYLALTRGVPNDRRIESVFVADRGDARRGSLPAALAGADGTRAVTMISVIQRFPGFALVGCRLETGRTHQVRIHLGEAGFPLCGERVYDRPVGGAPLPDHSGADRPMLHAMRLGFRHPDTQELMAWEVDPPKDFSKLLAQFRIPVESQPDGIRPEEG